MPTRSSANGQFERRSNAECSILVRVCKALVFDMPPCPFNGDPARCCKSFYVFEVCCVFFPSLGPRKLWRRRATSETKSFTTFTCPPSKHRADTLLAGAQPRRARSAPVRAPLTPCRHPTHLPPPLRTRHPPPPALLHPSLPSAQRSASVMPS